MKTNTPFKPLWGIVAVLVMGLALGLWIIKPSTQTADEHGHDEAEGHDAPAKPAVAASQAPAPVPQDEDEGRIDMTDEQLQQAGVTLAQAGPARMAVAVALTGEVRYNADRTVQVVPRLAGLVEQVLVSAGDTVRQGQVLAVLSSPALADQRAEAQAAAQRLALARATFEREKKLWEDKITAEQDYQQARAAMQEAQIVYNLAQQKLSKLGAPVGGTGSLTRFELRSPMSGVITDKQVRVGEVVADNAAVFTISDLTSVWVEAAVPAKDLPSLRVGQTVDVSATAFEARAAGRVSYLSALLGEQTRTATLRLVLPNPSGLWRPGLPVNVSVITQAVEVPVAVAVSAIQRMEDKPMVFKREGQQWQARAVTLGRSDGQQVEVTQGISSGDTYAATNSFLIKAELGKGEASHAH